MPKKFEIRREKWKNGYWIVSRNEDGERIKWKKWSSDPFKRSKNLNIVKSEPTIRFWDEELSQKRAMKELKSAIDIADGKPSISELEDDIDYNKIVKLSGSKIKFSGIVDLSKSMSIYKRVLKGKVKDSKKIRKIVANRERLLKKRTSVSITIYIKNQDVCTINIAGILLEYDVKAYDFWVGRYIDSNTMPDHIAEFKALLDNPEHFSDTVSPSLKGGIVSNIRTTWSFA